MSCNCMQHSVEMVTGARRSLVRSLFGIATVVAAHAASAGPVKDDWYANYSDYSNRTLVGFVEATATTNNFQAPPDARVADAAALGAVGATTGAATGFASSQLGELRGSAQSTGLKDQYGSLATFDMGWRDFLTISGGTGTDSLTLVGHFDGSLAGESDYLAGTAFVSTGLVSGQVGASFVNLYQSVAPSGFNCAIGTCSVGTDGAKARFDFSITVTFAYGTDVLVASTASGFAETGSLAGPSVLDFLSTSKLDYIVAPDGATVVSAVGGPLAFDGARWVYVAAPVPEPQALALMLGGLVFTGLAVRRRKFARHSAGANA